MASDVEHFCDGKTFGCRCREYADARKNAERFAEEDLRDLSSGDYYTFSAAELDARDAKREVELRSSIAAEIEAAGVNEDGTPRFDADYRVGLADAARIARGGDS